TGADRKLKWFAGRNWNTELIRDRFIKRSNDLYPNSGHRRPQKVFRSGGGFWTQRHTSTASPPVHLKHNSIKEYLQTPIVTSYVISQHGGVLPYWLSELERRPRLARMAPDLLTIP
ncbi:hypothetical protein FRC12_024310, partial [Ceratobasidium sp. 428]